MAEDTLISALEEDARAQAGRIIEEAREAAEAALRDAGEQIAREQEARVAELEAALKGQRAAMLNAARTRASAARLAVRHSLIERALEEAGAKFSSMPKDEYRRLLTGLFFELKADWEKGRPGEAPVVFVNPADVGLFESSYTIKGDEGVKLGVVFASGDGTVRFENSIPGRLSRAKAVMVPAMNEMLFDGVFQ
ncbi:V/A-type H+/Na+-transporting ATPase subunit E [uncultured bacterium]|nr:V/A-type H+/Na+-transporting ATPase subunit E [uncultured bacterium]